MSRGNVAEFVMGYTAFAGGSRVAAGELKAVVLAAREIVESGAAASVLIFEDATGQQIDVDLGGPIELVLKHLSVFDRSAEKPAALQVPPRRGRPKLGVVPREVTLLPRHWSWLGSQPGGASVTLRKLVEARMKSASAGDSIRIAQESCQRFMGAAAGDLAGYEDATRALFANDAAGFVGSIENWPKDLRNYALRLAGPAFA